MPAFVSKNIYKVVAKFAPVVSNDILLRHGGKYLLLKRTGVPCKGLWWTPGRRLRKNERITDAVHNVMKEEVGIKKIKIKKFLGVFEVFAKPGKFGQKDIHYVSFSFLAEPVGKFKVKMDFQHSEYDFFKKAPKDSHPFVKKIFSLAKNKDFRVALPILCRVSG
ncbi:MAG: NUDIX domain-containing protein [Candidatus Nealsonbacteria bacterium]|nr:NUDIX domain-containing protein [Candidatus Nealsonbacteria bacterium]